MQSSRLRRLPTGELDGGSVIGNGIPATSALAAASGVAADGARNIYLSLAGAGLIQMVNPATIISIYARLTPTTRATIQGTAAQL
jgi:hypothetical protein